MNSVLLLAAMHIVGAMVCGYIAVSTILRRPSHLSPHLAAFAFSLAWWSLFQGFELLAPTPQTSFYWAAFAYIGIQTSMLSLLSLAYGLSMAPRRLSRTTLGLLGILPAATVIIALSNPLHGLLWQDLGISELGLSSFSRGSWYLVHISYTYLLLAATFALLLRGVITREGTPRIQASIIILAGAVPLFTNIVYLASTTADATHDFTVIGLMATAFAIHYAFSTYGPSEIVPVARSWLVEHLRDPIAVVLPSGTIVDNNRSFQRVFHTQLQPHARHTPMIQALLPQWDRLNAPVAEHAPKLHSFQLQQNPPVWLEASIGIIQRQQQPVFAVVFRDVTQHISDQEKLRQAVAERDSHIDKIESLQAQLREQAIRDELTGLFNRRFWSEAISRELSLAERSGSFISFAMLDIDHFKAVNDSYGHRIGDAILVQLADLLRSTLRSSDLIFRFGGEEFVLAMPGIYGQEAYRRLDAVRARIEQSPYQDAEQGDIFFTVSIGAVDTQSHSSDPEQLLEQADRAMYRAKRAGRNQVICGPGLS